MQQAAEACNAAATQAFGWGFTIGAVGVMLLGALTAAVAVRAAITEDRYSDD